MFTGWRTRAQIVILYARLKIMVNYSNICILYLPVIRYTYLDSDSDVLYTSAKFEPGDEFQYLFICPAFYNDQPNMYNFSELMSTNSHHRLTKTGNVCNGA